MPDFAYLVHQKPFWCTKMGYYAHGEEITRKKCNFAEKNEFIMRIKSLIALACVAIALSGCQKAYNLWHGSLPSSVKIEKLDLTGAAALAVMPYSGAQNVQTKAGEGEQYEDRLFIVDKDGKTKLASFTINDSRYSNTIWKKIRKTLTIVPVNIIPLSKDFILFGDACCSHDYIGWEQDATGQEEVDAILDLFISLEGPYILRVSDGALFRSPFSFVLYGKSRHPLSSIIKTSSDGKKFILSPGDWTMRMGYSIQPREWLTIGQLAISPIDLVPWILSDEGNRFAFKYLSENLPAGGTVFGFMVTPDDRIVKLGTGTTGVWSFDLNLNPLFIDCSQKYQDAFNSLFFEPFSITLLPFDYEGSTYVVKDQGFIYRVFLNGDVLDCSLVCSGDAIPMSTWDWESESNKCVSFLTENGIGILASGSKTIIDLQNQSYVVERIPDDFPQDWDVYNEEGFAYEMEGNEIRKYDINTKEKTSIPIHWEQVDFGGFVAIIDSSYCNGVFSISGKTRTGQSVTVIIDAETGNVTLTDLAEYSGSVVKTYCRLN